MGEGQQKKVAPILMKLFLYPYQMILRKKITGKTKLDEKMYNNFFDIFLSVYFFIILECSETYFNLVASKIGAKLIFS